MRITAFTHDWQPIGDLNPRLVTSAIVTEEVNGENSMSLETFQELKKGDRLLWQDELATWHEYVVYGISSERIGNGGVLHRYYCPWSLQFDLEDTTTTAMPGTAGTPASATTALQGALQGTSRWGVGTVQPTKTGSASFWRMSGWEALRKLIEVWGGEVRADITVASGWVVTRSVSLLNHVGSTDIAKRFDYGHNVTGIIRDVLEEPWTCRVIPLGAAQETESGGYGRKITIESVNSGKAYLENADTVPLTRKPDGNGGWEYPTQHVENSECQTPSELKSWAQAHLSEWTTPKVSYTLDVVQLSGGAQLGEDVLVVDSAFGSSGIRLKTRIMRLEIDLLNPAGTVATMDNVATSLGNQLSAIARTGDTAVGMMQAMGEYQSTGDYIDDLISRINEQENDNGGWWYIVPGHGVRTFDAAVTDPATGAGATKAVEMSNANVLIGTKSGDVWAWKKALTEWGVVATTSGTTAASLDLSGLSELLVVATYGTSYAGSAIVPVAQLSSTALTWNLDESAKCELKTTQIKPNKLSVGGSQVDGSWTVYGR